MSKDKKNEGKEILEEFKELSEWQKRNQEYLKKKAEEEVALAEEKEKERQARMASKSEKSDATEDQESESDPKDSKSAKEESEEKVEESEDVKKEVPKEEPKSKEPKKQNKQDKKLEKKPVKEKPVKPKIPGVHIWRAISILFLSLILLVVSAYLLSPYATMKDIRVEGTVQTTDDDILQASGIQDSDYTINLLLDKAKYEEQIKSNYWVESAQLVYQFPTKFTIKVKEYDIVAYYVSGENHYPILSSGQLETSSVSLVSLPETYISVLFNDSEQIKTFTSELAQISPELKAAIEKVELAPSKVTSDLIRLTMNDSDEVLVPLSEMSKKLPYYSKIKPQLSEPSVIDMEAGIYSYTVADKLIMEAEEKAKQEAKEAEKKQKEEEKKRLEEQQNKLEEERKKLEEEGNQNQTTRRSSRR
ncbi:cell division protein DivIB [Streptococcus mitis]|uniref:Cell division protein DivIB n=1 Tax=Streptococcus mitis TaxID=28037 RepID=A0AAX2L3Z4_STRMT|nr:cell division protein FtsQ/DivIB [Streptococcus mitis]MBZ2104337.1 cell division protein FtsQ/DivIB [Streptococcus mitis]OOS14861.1 cell division protein DivIB [Streptococcus mitis]QBZ12056.1 POTRA domain, FtsQ-type family protein [Streptococcus mitis NCTC 12261]QGS42576.1 FtsQ-type POTRA domain-containing protein [Streptococcus mitis]QXA55224.1 cell division protein FtsQ/DivIB [Streptococcus mitis]